MTVGTFARVGRVTVRALHHYDAIGLLTPEAVDPATGYRRYSEAQLARLNRIVALKELGLPLEQVGQIVNEDLSAADLRAMLRLLQAQIDGEIAELRRRAERVAARLRLIDEDGLSDRSAVVTKHVDAMTVFGLAGRAESATQEAVGPVVGPLFAQVARAFAAAAVQVGEPPVALYDAPGGDALDVRAAFPAATAAVAGVQRFDVGAAEVASLVFHGALDGVDSAYQSLQRWALEHGREPSGRAREIYLKLGEDHTQWVTEVQLELD